MPAGSVGPMPLSQPPPAAAPRFWRRYWPRLLPVLVVLALATRLPSFLRPVWNPDEGFLATQAAMLADGGVLYDTVVDRKPPLLPWLYTGIFEVFGDGSLWPVRVLAVLAQVLTAALLAAVARRRWGDRAGIQTGVLYLLASIGLAPEDTQAASFGIFMLPGTAAAFYFADRGKWASAGAGAAVAALTKQVGGAVLLPVAWTLWRDRDARGGIRAGLGFVLPVLAAALFTGPGRFVFWTITGSGSYASVEGSWLLALGRAAGNALLLAAACAALLVPIGHLLRRRHKIAETDLWLWLGGSAVGVATGFHFFGHYYLQLIPPLTLLAVGALHRLPTWHRPVLATTAALSAGFLAWGLVAPARELDHAESVAAAVARNTKPTDSVLIWGMHPEGYWLAKRRPASRYLTAGLLTNFSGGRGDEHVDPEYAVPGAWKTFQKEMAKDPPDLVVDDSRGAAYRPSQVPVLDRMLKRRYERIGHVNGAVLYELRTVPRWEGPAAHG